tara:strand:+ start:49 stop:183 length:135 start_codon:yes stop_codon:yes gene_type:complete
MAKCNDCNGTGARKITDADNPTDWEKQIGSVACDTCNGIGEIDG